MDKRYVYCMEHGTFELTTGLIKSSFSSMIEKLDFYASDNFGINKNNIGSLSKVITKSWAVEGGFPEF